MSDPSASNISTKVATKIVAIRLAALTRVEYREFIEVPADMSDEEMADLVDRRYDDVDGGLYFDDPDYWERGTCSAEVVVDPTQVATVRVERDAGGDLKIDAADSQDGELGHAD
ncbi:MAG: hypothetical protein O9327_02570 [Polaromonas sp.]|nr:hypothetical protein [Polaromonas sp.]